jgi:hypothetical protein
VSLEIWETPQIQSLERGGIMKNKHNVIPHKFHLMVGRMLIKTNCNEVGDVLHVCRKDYGLTALNVRTGERVRPFISMLRNPELFEIMLIEKIP